MDLKKFYKENPNATKIDVQNRNISDEDDTLIELEKFESLIEVLFLTNKNYTL